MPDIKSFNVQKIKTNTMNTIQRNNINDFKKSVKGKVILPEDSEYNEARKIWNAMIDRKPGLIVQCKNTEDVIKSIHFARSNQLDLSIRGAGHNIAGSSLCDAGLVIDFSTMKNVKIDAEKKHAFVEPGATLADFDEEAQKYGLATPLGVNSTTGIAGLTVGGGVGWLTKKYGLTIDNLISLQVVTADGEKIMANESENSDLFWALRGGGGNFGVVTLFEFQLHTVGPEVLAGLFIFPHKQAKQVLRKFHELTVSAPEDLTVISGLRYAPPLPFLPDELVGEKVVILAAGYFGPGEKGMDLIKPLQYFGDALGQMIAPMPYADLQKLFDPLMTPGDRNYWKTHNFTQLSDGLLDKMYEYSDRFPSQLCELLVADLGGALNNVEPDATAWYHRDLKYLMNVHCRWQNPSEDQRCIHWAREFFEVSKPYASAGAYVNFMTEEENNRVKSAYGKNYERLVEIKRKYDPENIFHNNQNIKP